MMPHGTDSRRIRTPGTLPARATRHLTPLDPAVVRAQAAEILARLPRDLPEVVAARQAVLYRDTVLPGHIHTPETCTAALRAMYGHHWLRNTTVRSANLAVRF